MNKGILILIVALLIVSFGSFGVIGALSAPLTSQNNHVSPNVVALKTAPFIKKYTNTEGIASVSPNENSVVKSGMSTISSTSNSKYTVSLNETGLKSGTCWAAILNGTFASSTSNSILFHESNGTYTFHVCGVIGYEDAPQSGIINVSGHNMTTDITFHSYLSLKPVWAFVGAYAEYNITAVRHGISQNYSVKFLVSSVNNNNDSVQFTLSSSSSNFKNVVLYTNWTEFGIWLGKGLLWEFNNGSIPGFNNVTTHVKVSTPAGTFFTDNITITTLNFSESLYFDMYSGIFVKDSVVNSTCKLNTSMTYTNIPEGFSAIHYYNVTFTESGLPSGTAWYVNLTNGMKSGTITGTSYTFSLENGTYSYTYSNVSGYSISSNSGSITVNGTSVVKDLNYTSVNSPGISQMELYEISGATVAIVAVLGVVMFLRRK